MSLLRSLTRQIAKPKPQELVLRLSLLTLIYLWAFTIRLFSILRYESVVHEYDPWFNYRSTIKLVADGFHEFWNWFDEDSWYPLGRVVGGTVYPGLMVTAAAMYKVLAAATAWVSLRDVCVLTAPFFAGNTAILAYFFGKQLKDRATGVTAAALMAVVPGYMSRSVAGSFDNEAVAIFALLLTFHLFVRAVRLGTVGAAALASFAYLYMASSWGAFVFISNLIPLYVLVMIAARRYSTRLYLAYTTMWAIGSLLAMQVPFIGSTHITSHELLAWNAVWLGLQLWQLLLWAHSRLGRRLFARLLVLTLLLVGVGAVGSVVLLTMAGKMSPWTGRFWTLLDPTYAKKFIPIVASVSEHQPTTWSTYFNDLHMLVFAAPAGLYYCFKHLTDARVFLLTFALTAIYFSGIMIRLMLVAAPAFVLLGALSISTLLTTFARDCQTAAPDAAADASAGSTSSTPGSGAGGTSKRKASKKPASSDGRGMLKEASVVILGLFCIILLAYANHCRWVTSEHYSSPSVVLISGRGPYRFVLDDFREAYYWLRHNTRRDAKIMSWWDYGYQITGMANRTVIVDNNTWNNTHIATVGKAMASREEDAYPIMQALDVDYVLVIFGGLTGYSGDDINKFLWMVRIGGGVYPEIKEESYLNNGDYGVSSGKATQTMLNSLMYRLSYYDFGKVMTAHDQPTGFDRVRNVEIALKNFELQHLEEAFTSQNWLVRIYAVKHPHNRGGAMPSHVL